MPGRKRIMLAYPFEEKRLAKWSPPYLVQPKLDGARCRAVWTPNGYILLSSEENSIISVPHIQQALNKTSWKWELDGELYTHGLTFEEIFSRASRTINLHPAYEEIGFHIFDYVLDIPQYVRSTNLTKVEFKEPLYLVETKIAHSLDDIMFCYDRFIEKGYEGIIVRHYDLSYVRKRSTFMMKFKPKKEDIYEIIGYKEEISIHGDPKGRLGALVCKGDDGTEFAVGTGFNVDTRVFLWTQKDLLTGAYAKVGYQNQTAGKKVPRFPVFVEILTEGKDKSWEEGFLL